MAGRVLFPVVLKDEGFRPPDGASTYYVLAANGLFLERQTPLFAASVPVAGAVPGLGPHQAALRLRFPRLPRALLERTLGFFRECYSRWQAEGIVILFYAPGAERGKRFALRVPPQTIRGRVERGRFRADLRVEYTACARPAPQFVKLGTIHSHADLGPTASTIDADDECNETGLHIVAGYVHTAAPAFAAAFVVGRTRFAVPPALVLPPVRRLRPPPPAWLRRVTVVDETGTGGAFLGFGGRSHHGNAGAQH
jgi:hypothetical protein